MRTTGVTVRRAAPAEGEAPASGRQEPAAVDGAPAPGAVPGGTGDAALEVVVLVGIPASGKTTFFRERFGETHEHISKDLMKSSRDRAGRQARVIAEALGAGRSVVVDNTSPTAEDRAVIVEIAHGHGARAVAYYLDTAVSDALRRNARRTGRARVPDFVVRMVADRMLPPRREEGFDEIRVVRLEKTGFVVEPFDTLTGVEAEDAKP